MLFLSDFEFSSCYFYDRICKFNFVLGFLLIDIIDYVSFFFFVEYLNL